MTNPWHRLSALELRQKLDEGAVTPTVLAEHFLGRAADDTLGAYVRVTSDTALRQAQLLEQQPKAERGALWGLPHADKDLLIRRGHPTLFGSAAALPLWSSPANPLREAPNDPLIDFVDSLGLVSLGKTNTPEFGMTGYTESGVAAPARHPQAPNLGAGGSSGGAAVAVASQLLPAAIGSDGGGSVRIPAATLGLVGLKPSLGAVRTDLKSSGTTGVVTGPLSRDIADATLFYAALTGQSFDRLQKSLAQAPHELTIGVSYDSPWQPNFAVHPAPNQVRALERAVELLVASSHRTQTVSLTDADYSQIFLTAWKRAASTIPPIFAVDQLEPITRWLLTAGQALTPEEYKANEQDLQIFRDRMTARLRDYDVIVTPALGDDPSPVGGMSPDPETNFAQQVQYSPFTSFVNVLGWPAITVPVMKAPVLGSAADLALSVQIIGKPGMEMQLLQLGLQIENQVGPGARL